MHFGKKLLAQRYEPWAHYYIQYNALKNLLEVNGSDHPGVEELPCHEEEHFVEEFSNQVEQTVHFFLQQQGTISSQLIQLGKQDMELHCTTIRQWKKLCSEYMLVAEQVLFLVQFVDLNVTGIRKILKKHDRITHQNLSSVYLNDNKAGRPTHQSVVLRPLLEDGGLEALHVTLTNVFEKLYTVRQTLESKSPSSLERSNTWSDSEHGSSSNMSAIMARSASSVDEGYDSLSKPSSISTSGNNNKNLQIMPTPPILLRIEAARRRLRQSSDFVRMLAAPILLSQDDEVRSDEQSEEGLDIVRDRTRIISNYLNYCSTFLHMCDYYIVAPTSGTYAAKLGDTAALAGLIIGLNSVSALVSTILYSWWTTYSYKHALVFASTCQLVGCLVYASALPMQSLTLVILGRLIGGFGSARSINRRYIADTYPVQERTAASATFVASGALGTSAGPALAALLYFTVPKESTNLFWQVENSVGWTMAAMWTVYVSCLLYFFQDPPRPHHHKQAARTSQLELPSVSGETQSLLKNNNGTSSRSSSSFRDLPLWRNVPVVTTFFVYFVLKFILESLLSSTAILTNFYFDWSGSLAGYWLAVLGLLVLPANWVIASMSRMFADRELMLATESLMFVGCVAILQYSSSSYTVQHYLLGSILIFVSANALEGPNMSLLSKTIPPRYSRGLFNVGLLATESGTLGRAVGDVILTLCGQQGLQHILNNAFGAMSFLSMTVISLTWFVYDRLDPHEKDD